MIDSILLFLSIAGLNYGLLSWLRSDMKQHESKLDDNMQQFKTEIRSWKDEINKEMKDFHGRLCSLEEKRKTDP